MGNIEVIPTGIQLNSFLKGQGKTFRKKLGISEKAFVAGYVGRIDLEKNINFLSEAVASFLEENNSAYFLLVGEGKMRGKIEEIFRRRGLKNRLIFTGSLKGRDLVDAYKAMDVFIFSSKTETQGLVLIEAMASGLPVIAIKHPVMEEIIKDGQNGFLVEEEESLFKGALLRFFSLSEEKKREMREAAKKAARDYSITKCAERVLNIYEKLLSRNRQRKIKRNIISKLFILTRAQEKLFAIKSYAAAKAFLYYQEDRDQKNINWRIRKILVNCFLWRFISFILGYSLLYFTYLLLLIIYFWDKTKLTFRSN